MNLFLHGIGQPTGPVLVRTKDALAAPPDKRASLVLATPPFGKRSSITVYGDDGSAAQEAIAYERRDFGVTTTTKQLNFVQHLAYLLEIQGRAAVVVPDNVLFEGGVGKTICRRLLNEYDVHTLLRLPTGIFYAGGVKANVLFFERKPARPNQPWTEKLWVTTSVRPSTSTSSRIHSPGAASKISCSATALTRTAPSAWRRSAPRRTRTRN